MNNLQFIQGLYKGKECYADSMSSEQIELLHVKSNVEDIVKKMVSENRIVFLTGNPGDGKTFITKALQSDFNGIYVESDLNSVSEEELITVLQNINKCYEEHIPCVIAANEFPFHKLIRKCHHNFPNLYNELMSIKHNLLVCEYPTVDLKRICIVDLNDRNLLDKDSFIIKQLMEKFTELLSEYTNVNPMLKYNIYSFKNDYVQKRILDIFSLVSISGNHFVMRDILGALSYILVACTDDTKEDGLYYDAFFSGENDLLKYLVQYDPVMLSSPYWDERLWNGDQVEGWILDCPTQWPVQITTEHGSVEEAMILFKSIKRKFYFENTFSEELKTLQSNDLKTCLDIFLHLSQDEFQIKRMLINAMNKLFLSSDTEQDKLRVWTTHSFDLSRSSSSAVSTRFIPIEDLELKQLEPAPWLRTMEYSPNTIIFRSKKNHNIYLDISIDMLRTFILIRNGYPTSLLSTEYEQVVTQFIQRLYSCHVTRDYSDGMVLIANRKDGTYKTIRINNNMYYFGEGGAY